jgi:hypothetical protein
MSIQTYIDKVYSNIEHRLNNLELYTDHFFIDIDCVDEKYIMTTPVFIDKHIHRAPEDNTIELCDLIHSKFELDSRSLESLNYLLLMCHKHHKTRELRYIDIPMDR